MTKNSTTKTTISPVFLIVSDPYAELGIARDADQAEIKKAYFLAVRAHPPEREPDMFQRIRAAYEMIHTPELRARTDLFLIQLPPEPPQRRRVSFDLGLQQEDVERLARAIGDLGRSDFSEDFRKIEVAR